MSRRIAGGGVARRRRKQVEPAKPAPPAALVVPLWRRWWAKLIAAFTLASLLASFFDFAPRDPQISAPGGPVNDPFQTRFTISNPSRLFPIGEPRVVCILVDVRTQVARFKGIALSGPRTQGIEIPAGKSAHYVCDVTNWVANLHETELVEIEINVAWSTLGWRRDPVTQKLTWHERSKEWVLGPRL